MDGYISRHIEDAIRQALSWSGAVVIDGPKAVGKTETGSAMSASEARLDFDRTVRSLALMDPGLALEGATPRLLDEWQTVPELWNAVRHEVDARRKPGQFILTGSASPADEITRHTGTGRFYRMRMYPLVMSETGESTGGVSLHGLLEGEAPRDPGNDVGLLRIAERMIRGGWPASQSMPLVAATRYARGYLTQAVHTDVGAALETEFDPLKLEALIRALARTVASEATLRTLALDAGGSESPLHPATVTRYLNALERIFLLEEQPAWVPAIRSKTVLRQAPKRHLADISLACAALRVSNPDRLLRDPETFGILFESFAVQHLRTLAALDDAEVRHFRAKTGLEVDAIVQRSDGAWAAFEVKLGVSRANEAARHLLKLSELVDTKAWGEPSVLAVLVPTGPSYMRPDGVAVVSLTTLAP